MHQSKSSRAITASAMASIQRATATSDVHVQGHEQRIEEEVKQLLLDIRRIGADGPSCTFGQLFDDEQAEQYYEAIVGTLKCAKKRGLIDFKGQMLLKGVHDKVDISITDLGQKEKAVSSAE
ncbi:hypothetical protein MPSEU_001061700 [Mayamaea pseudoterrestris]|nr:hypothetical protein MPSEU_001061700 [Mayamaea pseudoterrestris]